MKPNNTMSPESNNISPILDISPEDDRIKMMEQHLARQSRTLRLSQLNTAPPKKEEVKYESPKAFQLTQSGELEEMVASKDILLMRCKNNIEELNNALEKERYFLQKKS